MNFLPGNLSRNTWPEPKAQATHKTTQHRFAFYRERLRRVLRKKTSAEYIFASSPLHIHILTHISAHLHIYISPHLLICTSTSLLIFTCSHLHLCSCSSSHICISAHLHILTFRSRIFTSRSSLLSLLRPGAVPPEHHETQPSVEIVRVECRRECALSLSGATLCGDRACRVREMQARVRFGPVAGNPLRRSRVSRARNAGESAFCLCPAQPSAEIAHVEGAKCRRECILSLSGATLCGDRACRGREMQARVRYLSLSGAEIVRVEGAKCRRECVLARSGATLCGDRACRGREMQVRVRFGRFSELDSACSTNVVRERAFQSWAQKWPVP